MDRRRKLKLNMISSLILQLAVFASGIILPKLFIMEYGSRINGLISSIQQFLGFISLGEMGIGAVVQYNLYKPLAEKNWSEASKIVASANKFFNNLLKLIIGYIVILAALLPIKMLAQFDYVYTLLLVISISLSYIMQYYFGMTYRQLLDADQLSFVRIIPQIAQILINLVVCAMLIHLNTSIHIVKLTTSLIYSIQPIVIYKYCKIKYPDIKTNIEIVGEPIKQKWNGIAQHLAAVVLKDTDVVVLTFLSSLENVSIYAVYNLVINGIEIIIESLANNFTAVFGELIAKSRGQALLEYFNMFESIYHTFLIMVFFCIGRLIVPFVAVYTYGVTDANYIVPIFAIILTFAQWLYCARLPYHIVIKAAGHYRETQTSAIIESAINIVVSVSTVHQWGIIGVAIGTAIAMLYRSIYYWFYLRRNILLRPLKWVLRVYGQDVIVVIICLICTHKLSMADYTYFSWVKLAICVFIISIMVSLFVFSIFERKKMIKIVNYIKEKMKGRI